MANQPTIVAASLDSAALENSINKLVEEVKTKTTQMATDFTTQINRMNQALGTLGGANVDAISNVTDKATQSQKKQTEAVKETNAARKEVNQTLDQNAQSQEVAIRGAQRYTEEIRKQAQAIRETKEWKESGRFWLNGTQLIDPSVYQGTKAERKSMGTLEEQLLRIQQQLTREVDKTTSAEDKYSESVRRAAELLREQMRILGASDINVAGWTIYKDGVNATLTIEEQLARLERERNGELNLQGEAMLGIASKERELLELTQKRLEEEKKLAQSKQAKDAFTPQIASLQTINNKLKELQSKYSKMSLLERMSQDGQKVASQIRELGRLAQKITSQMNRPTMGEAFGLSERTLDEIIYKMRMLQSYKQGIDLTRKGADKDIRDVDKELKRLQTDMDKYMVKGKQMSEINNALGRSWNYMKNRLAFYFTVGASTQFVKQLIEIRSQYEMNERALGILIGSAERGTKIFNELSQMALVSPYTLIELSNAAKQLTAYDVAAKDVVDTTRRLADMASAVGVPMERLTYALGQIKAYGYLNSRDARMFANAGIPLVKQLAEYYTQLEGRIVSTADVYDRMKKKTIEYNDVMQVVNKMTDEGGKFFDFQAKMADTLKVRLANLTLAWNNMLNDIGQSQQGMLTAGIGFLRDLFLQWRNIESALYKALTALLLYKVGQVVVLAYTDKLTTALGVQELVGKKLQARFASLAATNMKFVSASTMGWAALALVVADVLMTWKRNAEEIERLNKTIADGAKESAQSLGELLESSEMVQARYAAMANKLNVSDATKTWDLLRENIEQSSASSKTLIAQLLLEEDLNKRVTDAFNLAEKIQAANEQISKLTGSLDVSQDSVLWGVLGEGLAEDIEDYTERLKFASDAAEFEAKKSKDFWGNFAFGIRAFYQTVRNIMSDDEGEARKEIEKFSRDAAQTIREELGEEAMKDNVKVREAVVRALNGVESTFPQIKGKGKTLFETIFYKIMGEEFKGAVDEQSYYYDIFLEQLKKDHASAFSNVTDDILDNTHMWSKAQRDAIQKTADKVKKDLPEASQNAIDNILAQLNSNEFKVRIVAELAQDSLDAVQEQFKKRFIYQTRIADQDEREKAEAEAQQRYGTLMRKNGEDNVAYESRITKERQKQLEISQKNAEIYEKNVGKKTAYAQAVAEDAKKAKEAADDWLKASKEIEKIGGYDFTTKQESKAAKQAESELQKTLKEELQLIDKVRSTYRDLTKEGMNSQDAIFAATNGFGRSVANINKVLGKYGIEKLDLTKFAGISNPRELLDMLTKQLEALVQRGAQPSEIQDFEIKIRDVKVEAEKYDLNKITKGLNSELDKLTNEYELGVELDSTPELGDAFAQIFDIDPNALPKNIDEYAARVVEAINRAMSENPALGSFVLPTLDLTNDDLKALKAKTEGDSNELGQAAYEMIEKWTLKFRNLRKKDAVDTEKEWSQLLEKYGELKARQLKIEEEYAAKMALARKKGADVDVLVAIENEKNQKLSQEAFKEFQKNPAWSTATGSLTGLTDKALKMLINDLEDYKKKASNLKPKEIQQINKALVNLRKQVGEKNPFKAISLAMDEARTRVADYDQKIEELNAKIKMIREESEKKHGGIVSPKDQEQINKLNDQIEETIRLKNEVSKVDGKTLIDGFQKVRTAVNTVTQSLQNMLKELGNLDGNTNLKHTAQVFEGITETINSAMQGYEAGGAWGAVAAGLVQMYQTAFTLSAQFDNDAITEMVEEHEDKVKDLESAYNSLEYTINKAYGTGKYAAQQMAIANKKLQLQELESQLYLEEMRAEKYKDSDKISSLRYDISALKNEIRQAADEITNDLLGITSVGDAAEQMVTSMIEAFKQGEDYMGVYEETFEKMIDNMIMKSIVSKVIGEKMDELWENLDKKVQERAEGERRAAEAIAAEYDIDRLRELKSMYEGYLSQATSEDAKRIYQEGLDRWNSLIAQYEKAMEAYQDALVVTPEDIKGVEFDKEKWKEEVKAVFDAMMETYGVAFGQDSTKELSALQQGLKGVSEETASAVEAYLNGMSQQAYLRNDLLTQIRDSIMSFDFDVANGTRAQILLELQNSYQTQEAIRSMLEGWNSASGRAVRVEMV